MTRKAKLAEWQAFVLAHGWKAKAHDLAAVVGQPADDILRLRNTGACTRFDKGKDFGELFSLWHGRAPTDDEWPAPRKVGARGTFEWLAPEVALLASLVGRLGQEEIAAVLTARLRQKTGDPEAERTRNAVQVRTNMIGLQTSDVVAGITTTEAAKEIGSVAIVNQMVHKKEIKAVRVGRRWVIPYAAWDEWKAKRVFAPEGYVQLSTIREALAIRSDKLSEYARMGLIPTAIRCNPYGSKGPSTQFGTWWISGEVSKQLLADRRAGRPMPWHGRYTDNLRTTFKLWQQRQHPKSCKTCAEIWDEAGAPTSFEDYSARYPGIAHGAKRHLTRPWSPGLTVSEVAQQVGRAVIDVRRAIRNGALAASLVNGRQYVSRTDATRWKARKCPTGDSAKSWISLQTASDLYLFTVRELRALIDTGELKSKEGTAGAARGVVYVLRHQCGQWREKIGFTEDQAARRLGITVARFQHLLEGVDWRSAEQIPLVTVQAVRKRMESRHGHSIDEAAVALGQTAQWVREQIDAGVIRVSRAKWDLRRVYITDPMLERLRKAVDAEPVAREQFGADWLSLSEAALEAGVCSTTIINWATTKDLSRRMSAVGWRYHRAAVRAHAKSYWESVRFHRATPPAWLREARSEKSRLVDVKNPPRTKTQGGSDLASR